MLGVLPDESSRSDDSEWDGCSFFATAEEETPLNDMDNYRPYRGLYTAFTTDQNDASYTVMKGFSDLQNLGLCSAKLEVH